MNLDAMDEYTLESMLSSLNMEQLKTIRRNLALKNMSSLRKKELVVALAENIPLTVEGRSQLMDVDQYSAILQIMTKSGLIEISQLALEDVFYLSSLGYVHPITKDGKQMLVMPKEVTEQFYKLDPAKLKEKVNANQKVTNLLFAMARSYGMVEMDTLKAMIERCTGEEIDVAWLTLYIEHLSEYYNAFKLEDGFFISDQVQDKDKLWSQLEQRAELPYYAMTQDDMFKMNRHEMIEHTAQVQELQSYIRSHYELEPGLVEELMQDALVRIQNDEPLSEVVGIFGQYMEFPSSDDVQTFAAYLINVMNHTRLWVLKGHAPIELSPAKPANKPHVKSSGKKIGRNEPCPCGSGKKYKKCCGK
ncbi:YecA family protein [Bacillus testis]|uniref:YecA family protein n=1 Tax=Bacillus testis TaxID=1622072 RepID=UPI00067F0AA2|nr:SEC-C metal-binding domain-containing protein [Bacillus testis]